MCASADVDYLLGNVEGLKLTYDSSNMLVEGEQEQEYYEHFKNQIGYCHLKDVRMATKKDVMGDTFRDGRKMITTYNGKGIIDLGALLGWLKRDGYEGYMSVEYAKDGKEKQIISIFLEQCTPDEIMLETDTGWLVYVGIDAAEYVKENLDRIAILHLKDIRKGFEMLDRKDVFTPCGQGVVDFPGVIEAARTKPSMIYVLDQDSSEGDITEDNIQSIKYIKGLWNSL